MDKARKICAGCPVQFQCEEYGHIGINLPIGTNRGLWGGKTAEELVRAEIVHEYVPNLKCVGCGGPVPIRTKTGRPRKWCEHACYKKHWERVNRETPMNGGLALYRRRMKIRKRIAALAIAAVAGISLLGVTSAHAGTFAPGTQNPPAGYHQVYSHNFTTQGQGDWVTQPGAGAHVMISKSFGLGIELTAVNEWAELISSKVVIGPNTFVKALIYLPSASGKDGMGRSYGPGATANWPAWWTANSSAWPRDGEIDAQEGIAGHSQFHGFYGPTAATKISTPNFNATPNSIGTGWFTLTFLRQNGQVTAWYGTHKVGTFALPTNANETLRFQDQSYSTSVCASCFGPTLLGAKSTAWLSLVQVWSK